MIPYFEFPALHFGPLTLQVFGIFAALGVFTGAKLSMRVCEKDRLDPAPVGDFAMWGVAAGIVGGHLVHLFLYHPEELVEPWRIFMVWEGLSSFGGLLGAVVAAVIYFRVRRIPLSRYTDALALGMAPGWGIARLGCFAIHDHPGVHTGFFLGVRFPDGVRHDLGLYDAIALFAIAGLIWWLRSRGRFQGRLLAVVGLVYGTQRFFTDFLRAADVVYPDARYLGLTPAQYFCFALWAYGIWALAGEARRKAAARADARAQLRA